MAKVITHVYVLKDGYPVLLSPGDEIPEGVEITNPAVLDEADTAVGNEEVDPEVTAEDLLSDDSADADDEAPAVAPRAPAKKAPAKKAPADS